MCELANKHLKLIKKDLLALDIRASNKGKPNFMDIAHNGQVLAKHMGNIMKSHAENFTTEIDYSYISTEDKHNNTRIFSDGIQEITVDFLRKFS